MDAWNIPDFLLNSCLGRYDGRVYEALLEQTKVEPLNEHDITEGYYRHLQYVLHPEREAIRGIDNDGIPREGQRRVSRL